MEFPELPDEMETLDDPELAVTLVTPVDLATGVLQESLVLMVRRASLVPMETLECPDGMGTREVPERPVMVLPEVPDRGERMEQRGLMEHPDLM